MKPLKPSMKENKRYLLIKFNSGNIKLSIERAILEFIGVLGFSKLGLKYISLDKNSAVIAINRQMIDYVKSALCISPEKITVEKVSGTLKSLGIKNQKP